MCVIPCKQNAELKTKIDSLDVGDGLGRISGSTSSALGTPERSADDDFLPCRDPGDLPDEQLTECDGSGWYLPNT